MANNIDNNKPVAICDQLQNNEAVVTTPVESRIMSIRGKQIMIDRDLAELYGVETRVLTQLLPFELFSKKFCLKISELGLEIV